MVCMRTITCQAKARVAVPVKAGSSGVEASVAGTESRLSSGAVSRCASDWRAPTVCCVTPGGGPKNPLRRPCDPVFSPAADRFIAEVTAPAAAAAPAAGALPSALLSGCAAGAPPSSASEGASSAQETLRSCFPRAAASAAGALLQALPGSAAAAGAPGASPGLGLPALATPLCSSAASARSSSSRRANMSASSLGAPASLWGHRKRTSQLLQNLVEVITDLFR